jgi:hypothetical protein
VTGSSQGNNSGQDYLTIKYNPEGVEQWTSRFNGIINYHDQAYSIALDNSDNIYVTGGSFGNGTERDYLTIKYNNNGDTIWTRRYNGPGFDLDEAVDIILDDSANVYVTGYSASGDNLDICTIKYDSSGNQKWTSRYIGDGNGVENRPHKMVIDNGGFLYVTGETSNNLGDLDSYVTIKYDQSGDTLWTARYKGPGAEGLSQAYSLAVDDTGNVYVTGRSDPTSAFGLNFNIVTIKYNSNGETLWVNSYNGPGNSSDAGRDLALDTEGNIIVTGFSVGVSSADLFTIKYSPSGDTLWTARYSEPTGQNLANSLAIDDLGNIYTTGFSRGNSTLRDFITLKYNSEGEMKWVQSYNGSGNGDDEAAKIIVDKQSNVYITGFSLGNGTDFATIKYSPVVTSVTNEIAQINSFGLEQNYPNPFNPTTTIKYQILKASYVTIRVYNLLGKEIAILVDEFKPAGSYEVEFNSSSHSGKSAHGVRNLTSGIYFYQLSAESFVETKKMVLMK